MALMTASPKVAKTVSRKGLQKESQREGMPPAVLRLLPFLKNRFQWYENRTLDLSEKKEEPKENDKHFSISTCLNLHALTRSQLMHFTKLSDLSTPPEYPAWSLLSSTSTNALMPKAMVTESQWEGNQAVVSLWVMVRLDVWGRKKSDFGVCWNSCANSCPLRDTVQLCIRVHQTDLIPVVKRISQWPFSTFSQIPSYWANSAM